VFFASVQGLGDMLRRGYIVAATDCPGLGTAGPHPYLVGVSEGRSVLDSDADNVRGQVQGGVAMGIGQALTEIAPTPEAQQRPLATSNFNHALRRAAEIPTVDWIDNGMPSSTNVFGAKACGGSGASAAPPTVMNAIADALSDYPRARDLQMPARPADVRALPRPEPGGAREAAGGAWRPRNRWRPAGERAFGFWRRISCASTRRGWAGRSQREPSPASPCQ
jgi:hypothetical protein